jgi:hypothetical protein
MPPRTVVVSSFAKYLADSPERTEPFSDETEARNLRKLRFPYSLMLELSFAEYDFTNRWCWQQFGAADGDCQEKDSQYRTCHVDHDQSHIGPWCCHWFAKTEYNFGYCEWYFFAEEDLKRFEAFVPRICWGEKYE